MARNNRSGLGRGLNSLMGNIYEEAIPEEKPASTPEEKPVRRVERVIVEGEDVPSESIKAVKIPHNAAQPIPYSGSHEAAQPASSLKEEVLAEKSEESLPEETEASQQPQQPSDELLTTLIEPNPDQPRSHFKKEEIEELAASIEKDGLLQPILVRSKEDGHYQIIAGERRWQACVLLGMEKVPVRIKEADDAKALELALVENVQRTDLNPIEEAYGYRKMMERRGMTQAEVAQAVSKGRSTVANALRLLDLPEDAQQLLFEEKITAGHARAILSIPTKEGRQKLTEKLIQENLTVREAEAIARLFSGKKNQDGQKREPLPKSFKNVAYELKRVLDTPVRVKSVKGKNKIEIEFKDEEDLKRLFEKISSKPAQQ